MVSCTAVVLVVLFDLMTDDRVSVKTASHHGISSLFYWDGQVESMFILAFPSIITMRSSLYAMPEMPIVGVVSRIVCPKESACKWILGQSFVNSFGKLFSGPLHCYVPILTNKRLTAHYSRVVQCTRLYMIGCFNFFALHLKRLLMSINSGDYAVVANAYHKTVVTIFHARILFTLTIEIISMFRTYQRECKPRFQQAST